jgi:hypothetical protein
MFPLCWPWITHYGIETTHKIAKSFLVQSASTVRVNTSRTDVIKYPTNIELLSWMEISPSLKARDSITGLPVRCKQLSIGLHITE